MPVPDFYRYVIFKLLVRWDKGINILEILLQDNNASLAQTRCIYHCDEFNLLDLWNRIYWTSHLHLWPSVIRAQNHSGPAIKDYTPPPVRAVENETAET